MYRNLRTVIDQLDARRAQVYIESLIVEVTAAKAAEFGIQWMGLSGDCLVFLVGRRIDKTMNKGHTNQTQMQTKGKCDVL